MEEHLSALTKWVNHFVGPYVLQLLHALKIQPADYEQPLPEYLVMSLVVVLIGTLFAFYVRSKLSVDRPGGMQQIAEMLLTNPLGFGVKDLVEENVGHGGEKFIPFIGSISIFILIANMIAIFPGFTAPTAIITVPLACALLTFFYFNYQGFKKQGIGGYLKHFAGSPHDAAGWALSPLLFPVEIISTSARVLSLTVRLWANIFASDLIYAIFLGLLVAPAKWAWTKNPVFGVVMAVFPALLPILFILLHMFVAIIQSYVFTVLPSIYLGQAIAEEH